MAQKQAKQQAKKEYRSMAEFKKHFFPNAYKKELEEERKRDPKKSWDWFDQGVHRKH